VYACSASGIEVQEAFSTPEEHRNERQHDIVRVILLEGEITANAWKKHSAGQVICVPPGTALACARLVLTCEHPAGTQSARSQDCGEGPSGGRRNTRGMAHRALGPGDLCHISPASAIAGQVNCVPPGTELACARLVLTCEHATGAQHVSSQDCGEGPSGGRRSTRGMAHRALGPGDLCHISPASAVAGQVNCVPPGTELACARLVLTCEHAAGAQHVSSQDCGEGPSDKRGMEEFMAWQGTREQEHGIE